LDKSDNCLFSKVTALMGLGIQVLSRHDQSTTLFFAELVLVMPE
jgi:hypothetical protein